MTDEQDPRTTAAREALLVPRRKVTVPWWVALMLVMFLSTVLLAVLSAYRATDVVKGVNNRLTADAAVTRIETNCRAQKAADLNAARGELDSVNATYNILGAQLNGDYIKAFTATDRAAAIAQLQRDQAGFDAVRVAIADAQKEVDRAAALQATAVADCAITLPTTTPG